MTEVLEEEASILTPDDIRFEFEGFLEEHEENLPEGLDAQYMAYVPILEDPFRNLLDIPKALVNLPVNAVLHQSWKSIFSLFAIIIALSVPNFALIIATSSMVDKPGIGISFILLILIGVTINTVYMKYIYGSLNSLMESRKAPWLVEKIRKPFDVNYQQGWNRKIFVVSFLLTFIMEIPLVLIALQQVDYQVNILTILVWSISLIIGHIGFTLMIFISILSYRYIRINTNIYDKVLQPIIDRVRGYTEGHESILNKKNYEVVGVLSDTPGLSIRSLGDIPTLGLGAGIFGVNALIFLLFSPLLISGPVADFFVANFAVDQPDSLLNDPFGLNVVIIIGIVISSVASFGAVIGPLIRITRVMARFKNKALTELDPFIFDEITGVALRKDTEISNETQVLFMIRNYIYSMKTSPVNPFRLIYIVLLAIVYSWRVLPVLIGLFSGGGT